MENRLVLFGYDHVGYLNFLDCFISNIAKFKNLIDSIDTPDILEFSSLSICFLSLECKESSSIPIRNERIGAKGFWMLSHLNFSFKISLTFDNLMQV